MWMVYDQNSLIYSLLGIAALGMKLRLNSAFKALMSVHWWMATIYPLLFMTGTLMARLERGLPGRNELYDVHKSLGALTMALLTWRILLLLRVWWKKYTKRFPKLTRQWWQTVILHTCLYLFMGVVPVTGFFFSNSFRSANVKLFGLALPDLFPQNSALVDLGRSLHFWVAYSFLACILLHTVAQWKVLRANWRRFTQFLRSKLGYA